MQRPSQRPTPSSPTDRFASLLARDNTRAISVDHEDRAERRTAHLWGQIDRLADSASSSNQSNEDHCFEDFRPADPVSRLDSSARSARTSGGTAATLEEVPHATARKTVFATPPESYATPSPPAEMIDAAGNKHSDINRQLFSGHLTTDWATPTLAASVRRSEWTDPQGQGSESQFGQGSQPDSARQRSLGDDSQDSVETYHTSLRKLNAAKTNDRSKSISTVSRWLRGQRRHRPDLRSAELERQPISQVSSFPTSPVIPHVSTFQPADQHMSLNSRSRSQEREQRRASIVPGLEPRCSPQKEHKPGLLSSFGSDHKHQPKQQDAQGRRSSTLSQSRREEDPFGQASPLTYEPTKSSGRGRTGYFSRSARSSEGDDAAPVKGPYVGFSRRTEELSEPLEGGGKLKQPKPSPSEQDGWLKPRRPRLTRYSSSPISPCDTSARALDNPAAYEAWKAVLNQKSSPPLQFNKTLLQPNSPPPQLNKAHYTFNDLDFTFNPPRHHPQPIHPSSIPPRQVPNYLPTEARRVNTPPLHTKSRGNKSTGYFWDSWYPHGAEKEGYDKAVDRSDQWHTPFPMPKDASITKSRGNDSETGNYDWYRIPMDRNGEEPRDIDELRMFAWDLPEHLPNSPLCPLSPKHPSKGKGVCVYHGRKGKGGVGKSATIGTGFSSADIGVDLWK
jgi:hypothetical protein